MDNAKFKEIEDIRGYVENALKNGEITAGTYRKKAEITARKGVVGEEIVTVMVDGLVETKNVVKKDENGNTGWVVTNPSGEKYIVEDAVFSDKYEPIEGADGKFRPKGKPVTAGKISESISFIAPWGETMNVVSGGYLVFTSMDDIYAIQEKEFFDTYEEI